MGEGTMWKKLPWKLKLNANFEMKSRRIISVESVQMIFNIVKHCVYTTHAKTQIFIVAPSLLRLRRRRYENILHWYYAAKYEQWIHVDILMGLDTMC